VVSSTIIWKHDARSCKNWGKPSTYYFFDELEHGGKASKISCFVSVYVFS
jgi:hypothetical protein